MLTKITDWLLVDLSRLDFIALTKEHPEYPEFCLSFRMIGNPNGVLFNLKPEEAEVVRKNIAYYLETNNKSTGALSKR
jgi:hypothetical protein